MTFNRTITASLAAAACVVFADTAAIAAEPVELKLADRLAQDHYVARYSSNFWIDECKRLPGAPSRSRVTRASASASPRT